MSEATDQAIESLERLKAFDPKVLIQKDRLGENAFEAAVEPAEKVLSLFRKIPTEIVPQLSRSSASALTSVANVTFGRFQEILDFDLEEGGVRGRRDNLVSSLKDAYDNAFDKLLPIVSFAVAETTDFAKLEDRGLAAVQSIRDSTEKTKKEIQETLEEAQTLLEEVRNVAAEEGVLKQAKFFKEESESHSDSSKIWLGVSCVLGAVLLIYTGWTLLYSQIPLFKADTIYGTVQIAVSKLLVFSVLTYAVLACVRNYRSHLHNAVVNKHRQNALMTYRTLSEAGATPEARDTILNHAAAAIYAPVDSGYVSNEERGYGASLPAISLTPKAVGE